MRKYFLVGFFWELLRFSLLFFSAQKQAESSFILWILSQQLVIFYLYLFLCYNTNKYCHYMKVIIAGKALGIFTGIIYLIKMILITQDLFFKVIFTANILLVDTIIMLFMIYLTKKYFNNLSRE
jgi:hypothetical protein